MSESESNRSRVILKNTIFLYLRMMVVLLIGLYTSRVLLKALGETNFGVFSLVGGVITLFVFINQALSTSTQRFITFDLGVGDLINLKKTFSMNLNVYLIFSVLLLILLETVGLYLLNNRLNIEADRMAAANWVFHFMALSVFFNMMRIPYNALITAHENMSFIAAVGIFESILKLLIVYLLSLSSFDKLIMYSALYSAVNIIIFFVYKIYSNRKYFETSRYYPVWDKKMFLDSIRFSGLSLYEQLAVMMTFQGVDIIMNIFFGVIVNAAMGITKQVQAAAFNFISSFQGAMTPQITKSYALKDTEYLTKLMVIAPKFSLYLIVFLSVPIYFNVDPLLDFWLDSPPDYTAGFCRLILISSVFESVSLPLRTLIFAHGNITKYQLIIGTTLLLNPILAYAFLKLGFGPNIVLWIRIALFLIVDIIRILFIKSLINTKLRVYLNKTFTPVISVILLGSVLVFMWHHYLNFPVIINLVVSALIVALVVFLIGLSHLERQFIKVNVSQMITKIR